MPVRRVPALPQPNPGPQDTLRAWFPTHGWSKTGAARINACIQAGHMRPVNEQLLA